MGLGRKRLSFKAQTSTPTAPPLGNNPQRKPMIPQQALLKLLQAYWQTYRPQEYGQAKDPEKFLADYLLELTPEIHRALMNGQPNPASLDYLTNYGNLQMAQSMALEKALLELLPEPEAMTPAESSEPDPRTQLVTEFMAELP